MSNVYAIKHPHGFFKVGKSDNPFQRYENFTTGSPYKISLHAIMSTEGDANEIESRLHNELENYRWRYEWFNVPEKILLEHFENCVDDSHTTAYKIQQVEYTKDSEQRKEIEQSKKAEFVPAGIL